jgi:Zn-dependent protease
MMDIIALIQMVLISALPIIFAITLHEAAHGYAARHFGDNTAWVAGRISLNPLRHIDPVGTLLVPGAILALSYFAAGSAMLFGWAKPVPVNFGRLRNPKRDMFWVAAAGPAANLLMACGWALLFRLALFLPSDVFSQPLAKMIVTGIEINLVLMVLNLLPLLPLDGGRIVVSLLPYRLAVPFSRLERWGFPILLVLLFTHTLDLIMRPVVSLFGQWIINIFLLV